MSTLKMKTQSLFYAFVFNWFYLILLIQKYSTANIRIPDFSSAIIKSIATPSEFKWMSVHQSTIYQCSQFCYSYRLCKAFNFGKINAICNIFLLSTMEIGMHITEEFYDYMEREDISKELVGKCWNHDCDFHSKCSEINGHATCVRMFEVHKCGYPLPVTFGNATVELPVLPGTTVYLKCNPPYKGQIKILCNIDGRWTHYIYPRNYCYVDFCDTLFIRQTRSHMMFITTPDLRFFFTAVYCESGSNGNDWLILQQRENISFDFDQNVWYYEDGFQNYELSRDHWIGTQKLYVLSEYNDLDLWVEFKVENDSTLYYAMYEQFSVGANTSDFQLTVGQYVDGNCGDGLSYMDGFTFNITMDGWGGWWDRDGCNGTNLNGKKRSGALKWATDCQDNATSIWTALEFTKMKIRRKKP